MTEKAWFGAGCFWGVEHAFRQLEGVSEAVSGFMGGEFVNPTYQQVCTGKTGHVEVVEVVFDPAVINYEQLLETFWGVHDPTQVNRQGPDVGEQYRSVLFYDSDNQKEAALKSKAELEASGKFGRQLATNVEAAGDFYRAEDYHQRYYEKMGYK